MNGEVHAASSPQPSEALDPRAWVLSEYPSRVAKIVGRLYGLSLDEIEDLGQDVGLSALRMGEARLKRAWFFFTARNRAIDVLRLHLREARAAKVSLPEGHDAEPLHLLKARVAALPRRLMAVYRLRYELEMSERAIAADMGISRASVRWLHRSLLHRLGYRGDSL